MYCKKCGADIGLGYPKVQFCHMCGADLTPNLQSGFSQQQAYGQQNGAQNNPQNAWKPNSIQGDKVKLSSFFTKRSLPKRARAMLIAGAVLCLVSMFMYWIAPYNSTSTFRVPRSQNTYNRDQYGDLKSIQTRSWYDSYKTGSASDGYKGFDMAFGGLTFLVIIGIIVSILYKINYPFPGWTKWLPYGTVAYLVLFWIIGFVEVLMGPALGFGALVFPVGMVLIFIGKKRLKIGY